MAHRIKPGPGQESVWDYPRPPRWEEFGGLVQVFFGGLLLAESRHSKRVLETSHPPVYYLPREDIKMEYLHQAAGESWCEWKGIARYFTVQLDEHMAAKAALYYPNPVSDFKGIRDHIAFYAGLMDACYIDGERVKPQPGRFYGGWITRNIVGPFKGEPDTLLW